MNVNCGREILPRLFYALFLLALLGLASGCERTPFKYCSYPPDPVEVNGTSCSNDVAWDPPLRVAIDSVPNLSTEPCIEYPEENGETSVEELVDIGLYNNPSTRQAWAAARAQAFLVTAAEAALYPNASFTGILEAVDQKGFNNINNIAPTPVTALGLHYTAVQRQFLISYLMLDFGGRQGMIDSARYSLYSANWAHNRTLQTVMFSILQAYYNYMSSKQLVKAREEDVKAAQKTVDSAQVQFQGGVVTHLDVLQAQSNLMNALLTLATAEGQSHINFGILVNVLGLPPCTDFEVSDLPAVLPVDKVSFEVEDFINMARDNRPDLAAAYASVKQKKADLAVARSNAMPTLSANIDFENTFYFSEILRPSHFYSYGIVLQVPLFDGFLRRSYIRNAKEQLSEAIAVLELTEDNLVLDVVEAYWNFKTAVNSLKFSEEYVKYSSEAFKEASANYEYGTGTILDVLTAQSSLADARAQLIQARTQWVVTLADIAYVTGTLDLPDNTKIEYNDDDIDEELYVPDEELDMGTDHENNFNDHVTLEVNECDECLTSEEEVDLERTEDNERWLETEKKELPFSPYLFPDSCHSN